MDSPQLPEGSLQDARIDGLIPEGVVVLLLSKGCTLQEIGDAFHVTGERIRQIARRGGVCGLDSLRVRVLDRRRRAWAGATLRLANELEQRGYVVEPVLRMHVRERPRCMVKVGPYLVAILQAKVHRPMAPMGKGARYYHFKPRPGPANFLVLSTPEDYFILPASAVPRSRTVFIPAGPGSRGPWNAYRNAWHLIAVAGPPPDIFQDWLAAVAPVDGFDGSGPPSEGGSEA